MIKNMSGFDRIFRIVIVATIAALYYFHIISGTAAIILGVISVIFLLTSVVSFCPLYRLVGFSTTKE